MMQKLVLAVFFSVALLDVAVGQQVRTDYPKVDSLLTWLQVIDQEEFRLVVANDKNGAYSAVKLGKGPQIVASVLIHDMLGESIRGYGVEITDLEGNDVIDRRFTKIENGKLKNDLGSIKVQYSDGTGVRFGYGQFFPLTKSDLDQVRVVIRSGQDLIYLDQVIELR